MKSTAVAVIILLLSTGLFAKNVTIVSPNQKVSIALCNQQNIAFGKWYLKVNYLKTSKMTSIKEQYTALHGKRPKCNNSANEITISFQNSSKIMLNLILRAYNDGMAFRYEFPQKSGSFIVKDELTAYSIPDSTKRWLEKFNTANEGLYAMSVDGKTQQDWGYIKELEK